MIPVIFYTPLFYHTLALVVLATGFYYQMLADREAMVRSYNWMFMWVLALGIILYMGLRPVSHVFSDMMTYAKLYHEGASSTRSKDWLFDWIMDVSPIFMEVETWFFLIAATYVGAAAWASFRLHRENAFPAFLALASSFSFWSYGTNGLRNGLATSLVLLGMAFSGQIWVMALLFLAASGCHKSVLLPVFFFAATALYRNPRIYLVAYAGAVALSAVAGGVFQALFTSLGLLGDDRLSSYLTGDISAAEGKFSSTGFRWDFLGYSLLPIAAGAYYIFKKNYRDPFYLRLFCTYVACNGVWVLVIRVPYTNRFAYLSWFMMGWVVVYPLLKERMFKNQWAKIGVVVVVYGLINYALCLWFTR
jgi:hypothetical protein